MSSISPRFINFRLGDFECFILYDGFRSIGSMTSGSPTEFIFGDAPEEELSRSLVSYGGFTSDTVIVFNYLLIKDGGSYMLVDVGCGERAENMKHPNEPAGLLLDSLEEAGIGVNDIDKVVISHSHWDHFGGAVTNGKPTFPNADYVMNRKEADYIRREAQPWAKSHLDAIEDKLTYINGEVSLSQSVTLRSAPGHTPGMTILEASSGGETLLYTSDIIIHPIHVGHTDWIPSFENDRLTAASTRLALVKDSYSRDLLLFVPHIPNVLGRVRYEENDYSWINEQSHVKK